MGIKYIDIALLEGYNKRENKNWYFTNAITCKKLEEMVHLNGNHTHTHTQEMIFLYFLLAV